MAYEERGRLLFLEEDQAPSVIAGAVPASMPQLTLQWLDQDRLGRPYLYVNKGGDESYAGLALLEKGKWRIYKGDPMLRPKSFSATMFGEQSVDRTPTGYWFPNAQRQARFLPKNTLRGAGAFVEFSTSDPSSRAYVSSTPDLQKFCLVTIQGSKLRIGHFQVNPDESIEVDPRCGFVTKEGCFVSYGHDSHGGRLFIHRTKWLVPSH